MNAELGCITMGNVASVYTVLRPFALQRFSSCWQSQVAQPITFMRCRNRSGAKIDTTASPDSWRVGWSVVVFWRIIPSQHRMSTRILTILLNVEAVRCVGLIDGSDVSRDCVVKLLTSRVISPMLVPHASLAAH